MRAGLVETLLLVGGFGLGAPHAAFAQPYAETEQVDAMQCWRRVGANAVYVGERFEIMLTCSVVETATARAVPDLGRLEPGTLSVSPFEVLDGERYGDIVRGPRRFFQYRYGLRIIGEDYFGLDVELPALELTYRITRTLDGGPAVEGREVVYVLPPESVRVLALVPAAVGDVRELPVATFGDAETRLFRANLTGLAAAVLALVAAVALIVAGLRARRDWRGASPRGAAPLTDWRVARRALGEMTAVQRASEAEGWNAGLVGRALASMRLAGAVALGRATAEVDVDRRVDDGVGQLEVRRGWIRPRTSFISSAVTSARIDHELERVRAERPSDVGALETIREALDLLSGVRYRPAGELPADALAAAIDAGILTLQRLQRRAAAPFRRADALWRGVRGWVGARWPR